MVHAVLRRWAPPVPVIDLTHHVPAFDVAAGAAALTRSVPYLGPGVVLAVVDPGVGTDRRAVAVSVDVPGGPGWLVGPDNGLLPPAIERMGGATAALALAPDDLPSRFRRQRAGAGPVGPTFDGRDLFAPAAAHLVMGAEPGALGRSIDPASLVAPVASSRAPEVQPVDGGPQGWLATTVLSVDRFGNVQLQIEGSDLDRLGVDLGSMLSVADAVGRTAGAAGPQARRVTAFAELAPGELGVLVDSSGHVALVLDRASAAHRLGSPPGGRPMWLRRERPATRPDGPAA